MNQNQWLTNVGSRLGFALLGTVAVTTLYAEGVFDNPWIGLFTMPFDFDKGMAARPKLMLLLMTPVFGYLVAPRIRWLRDLLIIVAMCCFMASGLDVIIRQKPKSEAQLPMRWLPRLPIPELWRLDPNLDIRGDSYGDLALHDQGLREPRVVVFQTDAGGFRNSHAGERIDLLVLGDSFGAGASTTQERIFSRLLETRYGRRVYDLSVPGASPYHEYLNFLLESPKLTFQPNAHVIWLFFTGNDLFDSYGQIWDLHALPLQEGMQTLVTTYKNYRYGSPLRHLIIASHRRLFGDTRGRNVIQRELPNGQPILFHAWYEKNANLSKTAAEQHPHFSLLERTMAEMRNRAAERGLNLTIVLIPAKEEVYRWILSQRERRPTDADPSGFALAVLDACRRVQIRCLDTKPDLIKEAYRLFDSSGELVYWRDDTHFNERGHEVMAAFIAREILSSGTLSTKSSHVIKGLPEVSLSD